MSINFHYRPLSALLCVLILLLMSACATNKPQQDAFGQSGVELAPFGEKEDALVQTPDQEVLDNYTQVFIQPINTELALAARKKPREDTVIKVVEALNTEIAASMSIEYELVDEIDPSVPTISIEVSVTEITEANPGANAVAAVIAVPVSNGGLTAHMEAKDGVSQDVIARLAYGDEGGIISTKVFSRAGHAVQLSKTFAERIAQLLNKDPSLLEADEDKDKEDN